jgi:hypothetical protein
VENSNEEVSFGEENWAVISGDTLGDAGEQRAKAELEGGDLAGLDVMVSRDGFGPVVLTTLGSWMAWRLLAWQSLGAQGAVFSSMGALGLMMGARGLMGALGLMMGALGLIMRATVGSMGAVVGSIEAVLGSMGV